MLRKTSIVTLPLFFPMAAHAQEAEKIFEKLPRDAPLIKILERFIDVFSETGGDVFQQVVNFNKLIIELIDFFLEHAVHLE